MFAKMVYFSRCIHDIVAMLSLEIYISIFLGKEDELHPCIFVHLECTSNLDLL